MKGEEKAEHGRRWGYRAGIESADGEGSGRWGRYCSRMPEHVGGAMYVQYVDASEPCCGGVMETNIAAANFRGL